VSIDKRVVEQGGDLLKSIRYVASSNTIPIRLHEAASAGGPAESQWHGARGLQRRASANLQAYITCSRVQSGNPYQQLSAAGKSLGSSCRRSARDALDAAIISAIHRFAAEPDLADVERKITAPS
jgi:hypothetical protein